MEIFLSGHFLQHNVSTILAYCTILSTYMWNSNFFNVTEAALAVLLTSLLFPNWNMQWTQQKGSGSILESGSPLYILISKYAVHFSRAF